MLEHRSTCELLRRQMWQRLTEQGLQANCKMQQLEKIEKMEKISVNST